MSANPDQRGVSRVRRTAGRTNALSPLKGRSHDDVKSSSGLSSTMAQLYQGVVSHQLRKFRSKAKNEHLPLHNKDNVHIQVPLRMMFSTFSIFLIFPLVLFGWRQFHPIIRTDRTFGNATARNSSQAIKHDRFPTWMDEINLPPLKPIESENNEKIIRNETSALDEQEEELTTHNNSSTFEKMQAENNSPDHIEEDPLMHVAETSGDDQPSSQLRTSSSNNHENSQTEVEQNVEEEDDEQQGDSIIRENDKENIRVDLEIKEEGETFD